MLAAGTCVLSSCSTAFVDREYQAFKCLPEYPKTHEVYRNESLLRSANKENTRVRIDISDQRAQLMVGKRVAMDLPCCTGKAGKRTPLGEFAITSKLTAKRSTIFGSLYRKGRRVYRGDRRRYRGRYDRYVGSSLPYWMRLTNSGIGMHYSRYVHRYPKSNGCIRMPLTPIKTIFSKTKVGTKVEIIR